MSTITGVGPAANPYPITNQGGFDLIVDDFNSIGAALQVGDVSSAQTALVAFQQGLQNNPLTSAIQSFGGNSQANTDYQSLVGALQMGNLSNAERAFASLQADLQSAQTPTNTGHGNPHFHHGSGGASASTLIHSLTTNATSTSPSGPSTSSQTTLGNSTAASSAADGDGFNDGSVLNATA
jgi:hypothetical protein